jgi:hypothetical protein
MSKKPRYEGKLGAARWWTGRLLQPVANIVMPPVRKRRQKRLEDCYEAQFHEEEGDEELQLPGEPVDDESNPLDEIEEVRT